MFMLSLLLISEQKIINVNLKDKKPGWYYLGQFVFNGKESVGFIQYNISGLNNSDGTGLYFYSDGNVNFIKEYQHSRGNCAVMTDAHHYTRVELGANGQFEVPKTPAPKYWYVAVANCKGKITLKGTVTLNDIEWDTDKKSYKTEFDYSQQMLLPVYTSCAILFGAIFIFQAYNFLFLNKHGKHLFIILNNASTTLMWAGNVMYMIYLGVYANNGNGYPAYFIGEILYMAGWQVLLVSMFFLSQGYQLCTEKLKYKVATWVTYGITSVFCLASVIQDIVAPEDPVAAYPLESVSGLVFICARAACGGLCCFMCAQTLRSEALAERRGLLLAAVASFGADMILPALFAACACAMPRWFRRTAVALFVNALDWAAASFVAIVAAPAQLEYIYKAAPTSQAGNDGLLEGAGPGTGINQVGANAGVEDPLGDDW